MIRLQCVCGRKIAAPDQWLGKRVKCPQCGKPVLVAVPQTPAVEAIASAPTAAHAAEPAPAAPSAAPTSPEARPQEPPQTPLDVRGGGPSPRSKPLLAPRSDVPMERPPEDREDNDYHLKRGRLPRALGVLGVLVAIGAGVSCWEPPLDRWTLYIALGGVAISTMGFGLSTSRYRVGMLMPVVGLIASLAAMSFPSVLPKFPRIAPAHYREKADESRRQNEETAEESQRRGLLSVESIHLTGNKDSLAPEVSYKLINRSGKAIKTIEGSLQLTDREHRPLGGLALNLPGPIAPDGVVEGKNTWTMEDAMQQAIADKRFTAEYRAQTVVYADGTVKSYSRP